MPTEYDWKSWKKRQNEPPPPPEPENKTYTFIELFANSLFYIVVIVLLFGAYIVTNEIEKTAKIAHICNEQKGVAILTIRGDAVCIKSDVLTDVLTVKTTKRAD